MIKTTLTKRIPTLVAIAAVLALSASGASANTAVEVDRETSGVNCNPCVIQAGGESHLNVISIRVSTCADTITAEIYHDGTGHLSYSTGAHDSFGPCTRIACNGVGEAPAEADFDILSTEETAANVGEMNVRFCLDNTSNPNGTGTHCTAPVAVSETTNHDYVFNLHATCAGGLVEVEGAYATTGGDNIEIVHID